MSARVCALFLLGLCVVLTTDVGAQLFHGGYPRIPGAKLLVGFTPFHLAVTTSTRTWKIQPEPHQYRTGFENTVVPSISQNGRVVACARLKPGVGEPIFAIATYSLAEKTWREYWQGEYHGPISISPDGTKLAYASGSLRLPIELHFINLRTGKETLGPVVSRSQEFRMSWSPDGSKIVYDRPELPRAERGYYLAIEIYDLATGTKTKIADGEAPSWSPSGEWIAYFGEPDGYARNCTLVHPDGTAAKVVATLPFEDRNHQATANIFVDQPVWSPDSAKILLADNWNQDLRTVMIHLLDLSTLEITANFKNTYSIYGWVEDK